MANVKELIGALGNKGRISLLPNAGEFLVEAVTDFDVHFVEAGHKSLVVQRDMSVELILVPYEYIASVTYYSEHTIKGPIENQIARGEM